MSYFIELMKSICVRKYVFSQVVLQVTSSGRQILASSFLISMKKSRKVRIKEHFIQEFLCNLGDKMTQSCNGKLTYYCFLTWKTCTPMRNPISFQRPLPWLLGWLSGCSPGSKGEVIGTRLKKRLVYWKKKRCFFFLISPKVLRRLEVLIWFC